MMVGLLILQLSGLSFDELFTLNTKNKKTSIEIEVCKYKDYCAEILC